MKKATEEKFNELDKLNKVMPKVHPELVQQRLYGKQKY